MSALAGSLRWHALPPLWVVVLVIVPAVLLLVRFLYRREAGSVGRRLRIAMGLLRALAILLVLAAFFGPYSETIEGEYFKRHLILCVDTSRSMGFRDGYAANPELAERIRAAAGYARTEEVARRSRLEIARDLLAGNRAFLEELADKFRLHLYSFDAAPVGLFETREGEKAAEAADRVQAALRQLAAEGSVTRVGTVIRDLVRAFDAKNEPVAGIVLLTDGRHTGGAPDPVEEARRAAEGTREGIPIFPVAMGDPSAALNVGISRIDAPEVVLAGDEVTFTVTVHARGLEGRTAMLEAAVLDAEGSPAEILPVEAEPFSLPGEADPPVRASFRHRFEEHGTYELRIGVPPVPGEAVEGDNYGRHVLKVAKLKMHVLLVAGKPSYTYRFLKEALFRAEETIAANVILLSAEPEWPQESSRGLEEVRVFPQDKPQLAPYDVIVLLDVDPRDPRIAPGGEVDRERVLENLKAWVKGGGGLVLEAGRDGFVPNLYVDTPVADLLPVVPFRSLREDQYQDMVRLGEEKGFSLTPAGVEHPILRILQDPGMVRDFWESDEYATRYCWYAPVERAKARSATVLAVRRDAGEGVYHAPNGEPHPILALQDFGFGKVLWIATDELWRMRLGVENLYYWRFWSGVIRHLATYRLLGGNKRIKIWVTRADGNYQVGDTVEIEAKYLDEGFEPVAVDPTDAATMRRTIRLRAPDGREEELTLEAVPHDPPEGMFTTAISAGRPGSYRLVAEPEGDEPPAEATFTVEETSIEMRDPLVDMRTLNAVARASRGRVLHPGQVLRLVEDEIVPRTGIVRTGEARRTDLWDRAWLLWLFVALLAAEWILRRANLLL